jgi:hypothetical protein
MPIIFQYDVKKQYSLEGEKPQSVARSAHRSRPAEGVRGKRQDVRRREGSEANVADSIHPTGADDQGAARKACCRRPVAKPEAIKLRVIASVL